MQKEPVYATAAITVVVQAALAALVAFGFELSADQVAAVLGLVNGILILIAAIATRNIVWAPASVEAALYAPGHPEEEPTGSTVIASGEPLPPV